MIITPIVLPSRVTITQTPSANASPTAVINGPYSSVTGLPVNFSSTGSTDSDGSISTYVWSYGDGNSSNEANPSHSYTTAGSYTTTLTVTDNEGATDTASTTTTITNPSSSNTPHVANANGPYTGTTGVSVSFSSAGSSDSDGTISAYSWDFGDGNTSSIANPSHSYSSAASYNVSLPVTDNDGASTQATTNATILDPVNSEFFQCWIE